MHARVVFLTAFYCFFYYNARPTAAHTQWVFEVEWCVVCWGNVFGDFLVLLFGMLVLCLFYAFPCFFLVC